ncbi:zinc-ribbon domain-containing protein [bacterium]|nr:zinc-ribbon domain-containing protein [bacterium]
MFCKHCRIKLPDGAGFCTGCGAKIETRPTAPRLASPVYCGELNNKRHKNGMGALMLLVSILLILLGIGHMALAVAGPLRV